MNGIGSEHAMWTVRTLEHDGKWQYYLHCFKDDASMGMVYPADGVFLPDEGTALVLCDALNTRDFGRIDPEPYKGYWKEIWR